MKNKIYFMVFAILAILNLCGSVFAAESSEVLANNWYSEAERSFSNQDCVSANVAANKALSYYSKDGNTDGMVKATNLIGMISDCLKKNGNYFYDLALKNYTQQKYPDAIVWANKAKEQYAAIPDADSVAKCDKIIEDSNVRIKEGQSKDAKRIYDTAIRLYESGDYVNALTKANDALDIYRTANDGTGSLNCEALISAINNKMFDIRQVSDLKLRQATEFYKAALDENSFEKLVKAKEYAEAARGGYAQIGDKTSYNASIEVITGVNKEISKVETSYRKLAEADFDFGRKEYLLGEASREETEKMMHYTTAKNAYSNASNKYDQLKQWAKDISDATKNKLYDDLITLCFGRIQEVQKSIDELSGDKVAEELYIDANSFFTKGECKNASAKAKDAKNKFTAVSNQAGMFKTDTLIYQINECLRKISIAASYMNNATADFNVANYVNATNKTQKAFDLYTEVKYQPGIVNATKFKQKIGNATELKKGADKNMSLAQVSLDQNRFEDAIAAVTGAKKTYKVINYSAGYNNATALESKINQKVNQIRSDTTMQMTITGAAIIIAILIVAISSYTKRARKQKLEQERMEKERREKEEAELIKRRTEEKMDAERSKEMEAERQKMKAMIAEEMRKIELEKRSNM